MCVALYHIMYSICNCTCIRYIDIAIGVILDVDARYRCSMGKLDKDRGFLITISVCFIDTLFVSTRSFASFRGNKRKICIFSFPDFARQASGFERLRTFKFMLN